MESTKILWVIAHEPKYLFYRVAQDFKNIVNGLSKDFQIEIEILTDDEFNAKFKPQIPANRHNLWKLLQDNSVQIAQMQTTSLARQFNQDMHVLDMPYLFENHEHAEKILEGDVGQYLLNNFDRDSKIKGLAFTYSGGFRLLPVKTSVSSLGELVGASIRSGMSDIAQETMKSFGFSPVPTEIDETSKTVLSGKAVGAEHVAQRLFPDSCDEWIDVIFDTQHSLFLTSIVVNTDWWNNLDPSIREMFSMAAIESARNERALSIEDGEKSLERLSENGVKIVHLNDNEMKSLKEKSQAVYEKYSSNFFTSNLIDKIKKWKI